MANITACLSHAKDDWATPPALFDELNREFHFTVDGAANAQNTLVTSKWWGPGSVWGEDALAVDWDQNIVYLNCPYSCLKEFVRKAFDAMEGGATVVMLMPARTDTLAFHAYIWDHRKHKPYSWAEVRFLKGRLKFGGAKHGAPFPSMIVIFRP